MNLVEADATDESVTELMVCLVEDIDKTPVKVEGAPKQYGFVINRIWGTIRQKAQRVVDEGIATEEEVNLAMREGRNLPVGPLEGVSIVEEWD